MFSVVAETEIAGGVGEALATSAGGGFLPQLLGAVGDDVDGFGEELRLRRLRSGG